MNISAVWGLEIAGKIQRGIESAKRDLWLISPYAKTQTNGKGDDLLVKTIRNALARNVRVRMVVRSDDTGRALNTADLKPLTDAGMQLYEMESLHAKLYMAELGAVVTSLNLYAPTRGGTLDLGIDIGAGPLLEQLRGFIESHVKPQMTRVGKPERKPKTSVRAKQPRKLRALVLRGTCVRCGDSAKFDIKRPYCDGCLKSWARYSNADYQEQFCHECGDAVEETSMRKPRCRDCWEEGPAA